MHTPKLNKLVALMLTAWLGAAPLTALAAPYVFQRAMPQLVVDTGVPGAGTPQMPGSPSTPAPIPAPTPATARWAQSSLAFGGVMTGSSSTKLVQLHNIGDAPANYSTLTGLTAGVTADARSCASVPGKGACTVAFTYSPVDTSAYQATGIHPVSAAHANTLDISGRGLATKVDLSTGSLPFDDTNIGAVTSAQTVAIMNTGNTDVTIDAPLVEGDFLALTTCESVLKESATCHVNVSFAPKSSGPLKGKLTLGTGAGAQTVDLTGKGVVPIVNIVAVNGSRQWSNNTYAPSCGAYKAPAQGYVYEGDIGSGTYRVQPPGQPVQDVYCDMTSDGGGWTLVMRGLGGAHAGWSTTGALNAGQASALTAPTGATFKLADVTLNAIRGTAGIFRLKSDGKNTQTRFVRAFNYAHTQPLSANSGNAIVTYADVNVSAYPLVGTTANSGYWGITDDRQAWQEFFSTNSSSGYWLTGNGQPSQSAFCSGNVANCNMTMWVR